jgi:hypothetical protein
MLGVGVLTVIPYSSFLVLVVAQAVTGTLTAALGGVAFGGARAIAAVVQGSREADPQKTMDLLPRLRSAARKSNVIATVLGGLAIVAGLAINT